MFFGHLTKSQAPSAGYQISENPHTTNHGIRRVIAAAKNSFAGLTFAIREESAFRQELLLAAVLAPLAFVIPSSLVEKILMLASIALVLLVELLNSGVEAAIDRISFDNHGLSKRAKDYGSAAVLIALTACAGIYGAFLWRWLAG